jgi:hypothetical protein
MRPPALERARDDTKRRLNSPGFRIAGHQFRIVEWDSLQRSKNPSYGKRPFRNAE